MFTSAQNEPNDTSWITELQVAAAGAWHEPSEEGQLAVDVLETEDEVVIIATMAGTKREDISLHLQNDCLTIRGKRARPIPGAIRHYNEECYWGNFSRTIVLPVDVKSDSARSEYNNGVLSIHIAKARPAASIPIMVIEE